MIRLCPAASTQIGATPDDPATRATSIGGDALPLEVRAVRPCPRSSSPTAPTIVTAAPSRAAMTAWLPPLPPNPVCVVEPDDRLAVVGQSLGGR